MKIDAWHWKIGGEQEEEICVFSIFCVNLPYPPQAHGGGEQFSKIGDFVWIMNLTECIVVSRLFRADFYRQSWQVYNAICYLLRKYDLGSIVKMSSFTKAGH